MPTNPRSETRLIQSAGSEVEHREYAFGIGRHQLEAIQQEKQFDRDEGRSFVAVNEWMVTSNAEAIAGSDRSDVRTFVVGQLLWPRERRREQIFIAYAGGASMFGELRLMDSVRHCTVEPMPVA